MERGVEWVAEMEKRVVEGAVLKKGEQVEVQCGTLVGVWVVVEVEEVWVEGAVLPVADVAEADVSTVVVPAMGAGKLVSPTLTKALASTA